jgi:heterodisulfide reductase subunit C2
MTWSLPRDGAELHFREQVEARSGQRLLGCYQCGKCTAGCFSAFSMDYPPHQIIRGIHLGMRDSVLQSRAIWLCAACETCSTRCPKEIDLVAVMDTLRQMAYTAKIKTPETDVPIFHRLFLAGVKQHGRVFETSMLGLYNILTGHYLKDVAMAPKMLLKGKLSLLPPRVGDRRSIQRIFAKAKELEAEIE